MPSSASLRSPNGPSFTLREHNGDGLPEEGYTYDMREFNDHTTSVGHLFFHPDTREPPIPPYADLQAFMAARHTTPVVVDHDRRDGNPCERPHIVFAELSVSTSINDAGRPLLRAGNVPTIRLFTIAAGNTGRAFDPTTHFKSGKQYEGVDIHNWSIVNFDKAYQAATLSETFRKIYDQLSQL